MLSEVDSNSIVSRVYGIMSLLLKIMKVDENFLNSVLYNNVPRCPHPHQQREEKGNFFYNVNIVVLLTIEYIIAGDLIRIV